MDARSMHGARSAEVSSPYTIELIRTEEGVAALEHDWNRLSACSESPNVFMTYSWFRAWTRQLIGDVGRGRLQPHVLLFKQDETVVGIAPMVRRIVSRFGLHVRKLEFATYHSDYNELVVGKDVRGLTDAVMNYLARSAPDWDLIDLMELRDDGSRIAAMEAAAVRAGLLYRLFLEADGCLFMPIDAPWSETRLRKHLRFARRAWLGFEEGAREGFRVRVVDKPHLERNLLERIIAVEAQKHVNGKLSVPVIGKYPEVFRSLFDALGPQGSIAIVLVEKNDQLIAWRFLYRCGTKLWDYLTAYDHAYSALSPGTILICAAINYGFAHGLAEFDFLRGMDAYKLRWTSDFRMNRRMILWNGRWLSKACARISLGQHARSSQSIGSHIAV